MRDTPIQIMKGDAWTPARFWFYGTVALCQLRQAKKKGWVINRTQWRRHA